SSIFTVAKLLLQRYLPANLENMQQNYSSGQYGMKTVLQERRSVPYAGYSAPEMHMPDERVYQ
ncbi:hypothetical protein, partial [Escherichia coli]|uniref:hypothetical protein n=1 Tax=Escherichia coli TaxID=562 RepID=UPI001A7E1477